MKDKAATDLQQRDAATKDHKMKYHEVGRSEMWYKHRLLNKLEGNTQQLTGSSTRLKNNNKSRIEQLTIESVPTEFKAGKLCSYQRKVIYRRTLISEASPCLA